MAEAGLNWLNAAAERAAALLATDAPRAEREAEAILKVARNDPRALLIVGSARRRQGDARRARSILAPLAKAYPRAAMTHYELGLVFADLGEGPSAVAALRHAISLNRYLADAWRALGDQLFLDGDTAGAEAAFAEHARAAVTDPALKPAATALFEGRLDDADDLLRAHVTAHLSDGRALKMLADVRLRQERYADAEILFARCLELDPGSDAARFSYAQALFRQQKAGEAAVQLERLLVEKPQDPAYRNLLAGCLGMLGEDERVAKLYEDLLETYPKQPRIWLNYGHNLRAVGRSEDAKAAYKRSIALAPGLGDAYWSLANLKVASFTADEEEAMRVQAARGDLSADDRLHLHYALGKALEDKGDYAASFEHYASGARLRRAETVYSADDNHAQMLRSKRLFTPGFFADREGQGCPSREPIFILGLPRSGSTLIEQILASHSSVEGTMELPYVGLIANGLAAPAAASAGVSYPDSLAGLDAAALSRLGQSFLDGAGQHRKLGRPFFIDKMPNNFNYIGLIHLILPKAKIIDARRHPLGVCFSAFKQHFAQGQNFTYDLTDLGRYYRDYVELMDHFDAVLPGRIHRVIYENMVEDTEGQVRRLLDYCGLPFEDACLRFYENNRTVRTVSSEQVRQPIFRGGLEQWRRYEPWLGPLKAALGPALQDWRSGS
jgi:tetratricopeptide (TPR) repeat protein